MDNKKIVLTYAFRVIGVVLVLFYFFGKNLLYRTFPGLQGYTLSSMFYIGVLIYFAGAVLYYIFNRKKPKRLEEKDGDENK
ncbi:MAG: hypothetical protein M0P13_04465 [Fibrobacteraceae bacterium]|nr:hypothetical protein [Fibrobacteraceae bacterium]